MPEEHSQEEEAEKDSLYSKRTVEGEYESTKSISAKSRGRNTQKKRNLLHSVASATWFDSTGFGERLEQLALLKELGVKEAAKQAAKNIAQRLILKRAAPWLYSISLTLCFWQFVFAILSLSGFVIHSFTLDAIKKATQAATTGRMGGPIAMVSNISKLTDYVLTKVGLVSGDITTILPGLYIGYGFWALALIVGTGGFLGFIIFFHFLEIKLMRSVVSTLLFFVCMACTILPPTNIFPWLTLWIVYVIHSETSLLSMALQHQQTTPQTPPQRSFGEAANEAQYEQQERA